MPFEHSEPPALVDAPADRVQGRVDIVAAGMAATLANLKGSLESAQLLGVR